MQAVRHEFLYQEISQGCLAPETIGPVDADRIQFPSFERIVHRREARTVFLLRVVGVIKAVASGEAFVGEKGGDIKVFATDLIELLGAFLALGVEGVVLLDLLLGAHTGVYGHSDGVLRR